MLQLANILNDISNMAQKRVQVKIEFGHQAVSKDNPANQFTHDWTVFVKGVDGADISHIIERVVFHLHESFPKPKRVCKEQPYTLSESGYGSFTLPIDIFFKTTAKEDPRKHSINYELTLQLRGLPPLNVNKIEALTFLNPSDEFEKRLLKAGAVIIPVGGGETPKIKKESSPAPVSHDSPNPHKKSNTCLTAVKAKKESNNVRPHSSMKRSAEDISALKNKKKKTEKHDHQTPALKEIAVLSPSNDNDALKAKSLNNMKKLKEERTRRKSLDNNESPKVLKESRHKSKNIKVKKEKSLDLGGIPKLKFSIKRTPDESWATSVKEGLSKSDEANENTTNTLVASNTTTAAQQNDHVKKIIAEFAQQDSEDEEEKANSSISSNSSLDNISSSKVSEKAKCKFKSGSTLPTGKSKSDKKLMQNENGSTTSVELQSLHMKIGGLQDSNILQGIVDIVESSGKFDINSFTFDFDLSTLEEGTISEIICFLEKTQ